MEFLIKREDGAWFDFPPSQFSAVLRPTNVPWRPVEGWGDYRIDVRGCEISFSFEDPGIQVTFEGDGLSAVEAKSIVAEIAERITASTGQRICIVDL